ncbi:MAG: hypothetical protein ACMUJM_13420 [bacterium]
MKDCIFKEIISPILPIVESEANIFKPKDNEYTLSFYPFTINLLFCIIEGIKSISQLVTFIKTSSKAKELQLVKASKSMYNEAFYRYPHIPSPYECITFYYGIYSSSYRGKEKRQEHDGASVDVEEIKGKGKVSSTWARLIQKIFEIGPLVCSQCGKEIKLIAFITDLKKTQKILQHIGEETQRAPPLSPTTISAHEQESWYGNYIPSYDVYFHDEEYVY